MAFLDDLIADCKRERKIAHEILQKLESGEFKITSRSDSESSAIDATPRLIEDCKRRIAELDGIIARHPEAG